MFVISDEVYSRIVFSNNEFYSIANIEGMKERTIITNGFSKSYAIPGMRIGYIAGPYKIIKACKLINQHIATCVNSLSQYAALSSLKGPQDWVEEIIKGYELKRNIMDEFLKKNDNISWHLPQGTFYGWIDLRKVAENDFENLAERLLTCTGIVTVDGPAYGSNYGGFVRISFSQDKSIIEIQIFRIIVKIKP